MTRSWKESIYLQREELARLLREPMQKMAEQCVSAWGNQQQLDKVLAEGFATIPYCKYLYCVDTNSIQISNNIYTDGIMPGHLGRDRSQRPYMKEVVPEWGYLLSDAYISQVKRRPSITALQVVSKDSEPLGFLGADFDMRNLPVTSELYHEPGHWRQVKGDPAIRSSVFHQERVDSSMDLNIERVLSILKELVTTRGVFQSQIHFSSSQATVWTMDDPFRYRVLDFEALSNPNICLAFPAREYPDNAEIPQDDIERILEIMQSLRLTDATFYLRTASINIFNGMISLTFSCDGSHYMPHTEFLLKDTSFWF